MLKVVRVSKEEYEMYEKLGELDLFKNRERKEQFLIALAIGFFYGSKKESKPEQQYAIFRMDTVNENEKGYMRAIAIHDFGVEILNDERKIQEIARNYAYGGLLLLLGEVQGFGTFEKNLEKKLFEIYKELNGAQKITEQY